MGSAPARLVGWTTLRSWEPGVVFLGTEDHTSEAVDHSKCLHLTWWSDWSVRPANVFTNTRVSAWLTLKPGRGPAGIEPPSASSQRASSHNVGSRPHYRSKISLSTKVLDFVKSGGAEVDSRNGLHLSWMGESKVLFTVHSLSVCLDAESSSCVWVDAQLSF